LWPIYIFKYPKAAYELGKTDLAFPVGYILLGLIIAYFIYKKIIKKEKYNKELLIYSFILLYFYLVWAKFIIGYTRYAGVIAVLSNILIIKFFVESIKNKKIIISIFTSVILVIASMRGCYQYFCYGSLYNYSLVVQGNLRINSNIEENIERLYKDKNNGKYDIDGIWGVICDDSAVPMLLNVDDRIVHLEYGTKTGKSKKSQDIYWENILNNEIYVPLYELKWDGKFQYLDKYHFEITEIVDVLENVEFLQGESKIYIVKVKYNEEVSSGNKQIFEKLQKQLE
jgi:hypothetical protein